MTQETRKVPTAPPLRNPLARRVPLLALVLLCGGALSAPRRSAGVELVSVTPGGKSGTTDAGKPDSTRASYGTVQSIVGPSPAPLIAFESVAKDLMPGGLDVNGVADVYLFDTGQHKVTDLLSVATNGKAGCAGTPQCSDGGSHRPVIPRSTFANLIYFESDAQNLTPGSLPLLTNAQTQIYLRNYGSDTTTLVTQSSQNDAKGAVGDAHDVTTGAGTRIAFTFDGDVTRLKGLTGLTDLNTTGSDIVTWDFASSTLKVASVRQSAPTQTGNGNSTNPRMSADESCVVFESTANNLDGAISGSQTQIFVRYFSTNTTILVSKAPNGQGGNLPSTNATPNADCSAIVFESQASNIAPAGTSDANGASDVFLWTRLPAPALTLVSRSTSGNASGNGGSTKPTLATNRPAAQGVVLAFESNAGNLVTGDSPGTDVFVYQAPPGAPAVGVTSLVSAKASGQGSAGGHDAVLSAQGESVVFGSSSEELVEGVETNDVEQIWMRPLAIPGAPVALASAAADGSPANGPCAGAIATGGGVVFESTATNLTPVGVDGNAAIDLFSATASFVTVTAAAPTVTEGGAFAVTATRASGLDTSVTIALSMKPPSAGNAATEGADVTLTTIVLQPGSASKTVMLPVPQDYLAEGDEAFELHASVSAGFAFATSPDLELSIEDDDFDTDQDGVNDEVDSCPTTANPDQLDTDADGKGNVCDATEGSCNNAVDDDQDGLADCDDTECAADLTCGTQQEEDAESDGVPNINDNCVQIANPDQSDTDADGIGNACDTDEGSCGNFLDDDGDGSVDCADTDCAADIACAAPASDDDGDGVANGVDDCPLAPDPLQLDTDSDGIGDACDNDEGLCNDGTDNDADALVDCADPNCEKDAVCQKPDEDTDGDGFENAIDDCPFVSNADQADGDGDGAGDACDTKEDACANQLDDDADAKIDCADENCDASPVCADPTGDVDGDGDANDTDNCPNVANPDQSDADMDGVGDACDKTPDGPPVPMGEGGSGGQGAGGGAPTPQPTPEAGCACAVGRDGSSELSWLLALGGAAIFVSRRRRR